MEKKTINIATNNGIHEVEAELFKIKGFEETFALHESKIIAFDHNRKLYAVSELSTGLLVCQGETSKKRQIAKADIRMRSNITKWPDIKLKGIEQLASSNLPYPINEVA